MPDSLSTLEADRSKLLEEFLGLGDLRPGSITAVVRRCRRLIPPEQDDSGLPPFSLPQTMNAETGRTGYASRPFKLTPAAGRCWDRPARRGGRG